jgi:hypothetical protein
MQRTLKVKSGFIYFFFLMLIGISIIFYYYLLSIDRKYSKTIEEETFISNHAQLLYSGSNKGYILLYKIITANNQKTIDSLIVQRNSLVSKSDSVINELLFNLRGYREKSLFSNVITSREKYKKNIVQFNDYLKTDKKDSANIFLANKIESSFLNYQENLNRFIYSKNINTIEISDNITSEVKRNSFFILLFGLSPVIIFLTFLIILGIFIILMMIFFLRDIKYDR